MHFEWFIARRYFRGKRQESRFLSFIKIMAIAGVALGSGGLLIALSIVHGFKSTIEGKITGFMPNITVETFSGEPISRADTLVAYLNSRSDVANAQPVDMSQVMVQTGDHAEGVILRGMNQDNHLSSIRKYITTGSYNLSSDSAGLPGIVVGASVAKDLQTKVGDRLTVYTLNGIPSPINLPDIMQFRLKGIYETGIDKFDDALAIVDRRYSQSLLHLNSAEATRVELNVTDPTRINAITDSLYQSMGVPYFVQSVYDSYSGIFAWVNLQEQTIPLVIGVMIIVAAFNLIGTILMMVLERTRDIGILKAIGTTAKRIRRLFLLEGLLVAIVGLIIGVGLAILFNWIQGTWHLIPLSETNYFMKYAPVQPHVTDFLWVSFVTLILCILASWLPARVASKTDPLRTIAFAQS